MTEIMAIMKKRAIDSHNLPNRYQCTTQKNDKKPEETYDGESFETILQQQIGNLKAAQGNH